MTTVYIIDNEGDIQSSVGDGRDFVASEDEVQMLNAVESDKPDLVLLHFAVRGNETEEYIALLRNANIETEVVVIGDNLQEEQIINCILAGAKGYQNLSELNQYFEKMVRVVVDGEAWVSRKMVSKLINYWRSH